MINIQIIAILEMEEEKYDQVFLIKLNKDDEESRKYVLDLLRQIKETKVLLISMPNWCTWYTTNPNLFHILDYLKSCGHISGWAIDQPVQIF